MSIDILFPTTPNAGDQFTMTCTISISERLVHDPSAVIWSYDFSRNKKVEVLNSDATLGKLTIIGNLILCNLTLNPVKTSDGRSYYCSVLFGDLGVTGHVLRALSVQSKLFIGKKCWNYIFYYSPSTQYCYHT